MNSADYRIESIEKAKVNGVSRKVFKAFRRQGSAFVFCGQFSAAPKTANRDLWKIADEARLAD